MKKDFLIITVIFGLFLSCGEQKDPNEFILLGDYTGNSKYLVLGYKDLNGNYKSDTLILKNNKFEVSGKIIGAVKARLEDDQNSRYFEHPNAVQFFLEPNTIKISLKEDAFKDAKIENSKSQVEFENLNNLINPIYEMAESLRSKRGELSKQKSADIDIDKKKELENQIQQIDIDFGKLLDSAKYVNLNFARKNPNSFIGLYALSIYYEKMPLDTLKSYYNNFNPKVQNSVFGQEIASHIDKASTSKAPNFEELDVNGNTLSLSSFQGKYVLLDFWAGWCKPCIELHPELTEVFKKYNPKGLEIIGISLDQDKESWIEAIDTNQLHLWHQIYTGADRDENSIPYNYNISSIPAYILIDKEGEIIGRYLNAAREDNNSVNDISALEDKLEELLSNPNKN